jgi:hypothetical protein
MRWDPTFLERSPMFEPLRVHGARLAHASGWPDRELLQRLLDERGVRTGGGAALRLVEPQALRRVRKGPAATPSTAHPGATYEQRIYTRGELEVRTGWHDLFNVLAWLTYPRTKAALNRCHYHAVLAPRGEGSREAAPRGAARDALTLFDENGVIVASSEPELLADIAAFRWKRLFWERRERVRRALYVCVVGHGLMEKALQPYVGMTAHALLVDVPEALLVKAPPERMERLDALVAARLAREGGLASPRALAPFPVLGLPGWWAGNDEVQFYDDTRYFRPGRGASPRAG